MSDMTTALDRPAPRTPRSTEPPQSDVPGPDSFVQRHIGPRAHDLTAMLSVCGYQHLDELIEDAVPASIRLRRRLQLPEAVSEPAGLAELRSLASRNEVWRSFIGLGYYDCLTPPVIQRNILENPGWYTQYTPYQSEISQGRLEALLNFQTLVAELTAMDVANASLLDESTAAAEAVGMSWALRGGETRTTLWVDEDCHPQTIAVVRTRAAALGLRVVTGDAASFEPSQDWFAALWQSPDTRGRVRDLEAHIEAVHRAGGMALVATDLLALTLVKPPGEHGADVVVGSAQRLGVPLGFGGPHAAFFATRDSFRRHMPGRLVGVSKDAQGRPALRLTLQTREQHIRREKATSNICTAQVLLAVMASMYAVYHGPEGLRRVAERIRGLTGRLASGLRRLGYQVGPDAFFDTLTVRMEPGRADAVAQAAARQKINLRRLDDRTWGVSLDEVTAEADVEMLWRVFNGGTPPDVGEPGALDERTAPLPESLRRTSYYLEHAVFKRHHSETEMLRYIRRLESRDLSLTSSMIPLGSCTMKLNATSEMLPVTWPEFGRLHPFAPDGQTAGYRELFRQLEAALAEITGFAAVSLQPNAGSQGEYAGLMVIRQYHESRGESDRRTCLIPTSAHGTNPASAVMAGLRVVAVSCDRQGNIDLEDLRAKAAAHREDLAGLMVTYPSTHGVFEETIQEICSVVHAHGGMVYMDGANLNAQVGLCRPADMGADVCHINLHKTFCIPHGGGGPGMGPICVASHLAEFLPNHPATSVGGARGVGAIAAAPWGSASILPISWMYIRLMGAEGLADATRVAILNANYIAKRLEPYFPVLYKGRNGLVAHECILDLRPFRSITVEDVAKRLMDYGFHAPTISWPVAGTMMVEPTESESKEELDRFCDAMIRIHAEIQAIESGAMDAKNNPLKRAPHTAAEVTAEQWDRPYTRTQAAYPAPWLQAYKFWPAVGRIDNVYGDRNPVCSCAGMEAYTEADPREA